MRCVRREFAAVATRCAVSCVQTPRLLPAVGLLWVARNSQELSRPTRFVTFGIPPTECILSVIPSDRRLAMFVDPYDIAAKIVP